MVLEIAADGPGVEGASIKLAGDSSNAKVFLPGLQFETRLTDAVFQNRFVTFWFECLRDSERSVRHQRVH
jgi:hypothetical protein